MIKYLAIAILALNLNTIPLKAEELPPELRGFSDLGNVVPINDEYYATHKKTDNLKSLQQEIIPFIKDNILEQAAININNPEQVFCYQVSKRPKNYKGYTINNHAIVNFCGELNLKEITTTYEALFTRSPNIIIQKSQCYINPQIMLRFARGVDYTDVLLSSPCPSFTIFYAGQYKSFNIKQGVIDDIINLFTDKQEPFNSPAYLKQLVANGTATNIHQEHELEKKQKEQTIELSPSPEEPTEKKSGWRNIKLKI